MENQEQRVSRNNGNIIKKSDTLLSHIEITVSESEKRNNGALNLRDYYTVYLIETKLIDLNYQHKIAKLATVWRRYTEFEQLRDYLELTYPYIVLPPLPEKRVMFGWQKISNDTFDPNFIDRRRAGLENFLLRIASHPVVNWDRHFIEFLQEEDGWKESLKSNGYLQLMENKLKNLSVAIRLKHPDPQFESYKDYSYKLHTNLNNLLKARCKVAERQYAVHKLHANYGRVFSEWSASEKEMGDNLQKIGHYLDSLASCIDAALEDEELLADQLKEYLFFSNSLQSVCKSREILQLELEDAEENIANKNIERTKVQQGKSGLMSRLFGAVDTDEVRELKMNMLEQQIQEGAVAVNNNKECLRTFSSKAVEDIKRFQTQKNSDLRETLTSYAFLQLKTAKKGLQTWVQIRDCLLNIP
ncbi:sorting nexin-4-like isoform X1 [Sitophilus oryzae]|uniref:Sorting nexin-4-like isoform X1 n=1 Tax=Sitophilus oryzae TaxID=7048 RepID=A0A6J2X3P8_SITOR|nr:sorting nexin-4-like isoform X1 [Sitophilus oryzae]